MEFIKKNLLWILIAVAVIIIIVIYSRNKKKSQTVGVIGKVDTSTTSSIVSTSNNTVSSESRFGTDQTKWQKGDRLVAISPIVNVYSSKTISQANIQDTASSNQILGRFLLLDGNFAKIEYATTKFGVPYVTTGYVFLTNGITSAGLPNVKSVVG